MAPLTTPKTFACEVCSEVFKSQRDLDNHMCLRHDDCGEARLGAAITFRCATCGEGFVRRSDLHAHLLKRGHGNPAEWDKPAGQRPPRRGSRRP